jgi:hypothetical protein
VHQGVSRAFCRLLDVRQDAFQLVQTVVADDELALARGGVLKGDFGTQSAISLSRWLSGSPAGAASADSAAFGFMMRRTKPSLSHTRLWNAPAKKKKNRWRWSGSRYWMEIPKALVQVVARVAARPRDLVHRGTR